MKLALIIILALLGATLATGFWLLCIASRRLEDKIEDEEDERSIGDENFDCLRRKSGNND